MHRFTHLLLSLLPALTALNAAAQHKSISIDSTSISYSIQSPDSLSTRIDFQPDTLPDNIQYYDPATQHYQVYATQGNIGLACNNIIPDFVFKSGFYTGINAFDLYRFDPDQIKIYRHYYPFTDVRYVMGGKKEQVFEITHSQNIGKQFTLTANLRIINSPGSYVHQKSDISNLIFTGQYHSRNNKYRLTLSLCQNILKLQENGGIVKDSIFENNTEPDRRVIPVNLSSAQNRIRETSIVLWQQYQFLKDSTLIQKTWLRYLPVTFSHFARYTENSFVYEESGTTSDFYPFPSLDTTLSQDEILLHQLNNSLLLRNPGQVFLNYAVGLNHEYIDIINQGYKAIYSQFSTNFDVILKFPLRFNIRVSGQRFYGGYNDKDNYSELRLLKYFGDESHPKARISLWHRRSTTTPYWTQLHYESNLFNWDNDFVPLKSNSLGAEISYKKLEVGYRLHNLKHFIIGDSLTSIPVQLSNDLNIMQYYAQLRLKLWKIVIDNRIDYQHVDKKNNYRLPEIITRHAVYFDFNLFKGAMILQPGVDFYWQSGYYADVYMPATRTFYLQHTVMLHDQFYADVFINMKVSRARIFLKYQHFNSHFGSYDYYQIPHYPVQDAAIRFGMYWLLRDLPDKDKKFVLDEK